MPGWRSRSLHMTKMTNDEFLMTKEIRIPNSEREAPAPDGAFDHSSFVILSPFVIRISALLRASLRRLNLNTDAGA